ncbi:MAG: potassium channel family protein [Candidatus Heimdallarchaeota archaeon]
MQVFLQSILVAARRLKVISLFIVLTVAIGTFMFQFFYSPLYDPHFNQDWLDSSFAIIGLMFAMELYTFPHTGNILIKLIYVLYPFLGLALIGVGFLEFSMVIFTQRYRLNVWNEWMARTMEEHTIVVGLGNVGTRVIEELRSREMRSVLITEESEGHSELLEELLADSHISVVSGDASKRSVLEEANVAKARAIIIVNDDDLLNFKVATLAKELNPKIRTVMRVFDQNFSEKVTDLFDVDAAISTSAIAAPVFVSTSFESGIIQTLRKGNAEFHLMEIVFTGSFERVTVRELEEKYDINLLAVNKEAYPEPRMVVRPEMTVLAFGHIEALKAIKDRYAT